MHRTTTARKVSRKRTNGPASNDLAGDSTITVLLRAREGDQSAVRILIERALPRLRRWAHNRIPRGGRGAADTEDIIQDVVLRTLKRRASFEHRTVDGLQHYLRKSIVNEIRTIARRVDRRGAPLDLPDAIADPSPSPEDQAILRQDSARFLEALSRLRPPDRQVIIWRFEVGYSYDEIAERLGKSTETTHTIVSRARKRLISAMGD